MRKIILVTAMVLASASAHAAPRSLSLSAPPEQASAPPATMETTATTQMSEVAPATAAPKYVDRPPAVSTPPAVTTAAAPATTSKPTAKAGKPKRKHTSTERRIISELHRHGIYW
ncbi:hypothetical protein AC629_38865 [Bradyrhizobium sp. NAS80.1]|uniref:hypothetical protein n=1 Tax=Bradyrhizobium sp. NAS80.1 TaxID=1680159 RepID=UPI000962C18C|nr:hypothetical protein [Bradyrhizobium sp. NAS80.1]OKO71879.1 hypothetical protein AC629_38865 [Bradyrhizobium sp. NAS80.1]